MMIFSAKFIKKGARCVHFHKYIIVFFYVGTPTDAKFCDAISYIPCGDPGILKTLQDKN